MVKTDKPLDEVAMKATKTDKKVKKDKKKGKDASKPTAAQVDAGLGLFKGKKSDLDDIFGKGVSLPYFWL
jgi:hypothetical protein